MQAVILAGGFGSRVKYTSVATPKPLIIINDKPFLFYLLSQIDTELITEVLILTGYKSKQIVQYIDEIKSQFSFNISIESTPLNFDTGSRLLAAKHKLEDKFLFLYGDNYLPLSITKFLQKYMDTSKNIISGYLNNDSYSRSNLAIDGDGELVTHYGRSNTNIVATHTDIGYGIFYRDDLGNLSRPNMHFGNDVMRSLIEKGKLYLNEIHQRYYTVGTAERTSAFRDFISQSNYKYILLDRDGVINEKPVAGHYVTKYKEFKFQKNICKAIKALNDKGYRLIVITNQAGVARGMLTEEQLDEIHVSMCEDVAKAGGKITAIYSCPHHWEENCLCRKPAPGMLKRAAIDFGIDLSKTYFAGDSDSDCDAANLVDCNFLRVTENQSLYEISKGID